MTSSEPRYALLIIDMINDLEFNSGYKLLPHALESAKKIAELKHVLKNQGVPIIYVNDNYGKWQSDFRHLVSHCLEENVRGKPIAEIMKPDTEDYFVLKPKYSGFFATPLDLLLNHLNINTLILTGVAGNMCVQFTANDAYMRDYQLYIPSDCVASNSKLTNEHALSFMEEVLKADISPSSKLVEKMIKRNLD
ncbi:cysteine hydrolase [Alkalihalobacillus sp. MEB130]|uniref:cysteine hydrolase family protein n=1 Tax=Alkalihalobacillus sp. MEB130 TaxID=2976704 RepID=UPI0028DD9027|nr:isochorismatase family cysteine hydrolase [Alkalihalobacillus sp. MEB130]MDT8858601.1 cysteine hydrolase [Alkalihalobacillus sp. MEB130]